VRLKIAARNPRVLLDVAWGIASSHGRVLEDAGLAEMRQGKSATIQKGPYRGQELSVDHIIPRAVVPELDNVIANLELMPMRLNASKGDKIGDRQRSYAQKLFEAGLLGEEGLRRVLKAGR
jgi:DNA-binding transcriptional ArsR family regulator